MAFLGGFYVELEGNSPVSFQSNKARGLLAYLAVECARAHSREALTELFWPDYGQEAAQSNLRNTLSGLRDSIRDRSADPPFLLVTRKTLQFNQAADAHADVWAFETGPPDPRRAVEAYKGLFLQGLSLPDSAPFEDWLERTRTRLAEEVQLQLGALAAQAESYGDYSGALAYAQRGLELEPWREEAHRIAMRAYGLMGQRSAALVQYDICVHALAEELAVEPQEDTLRLRDVIASGQLEDLRAGEMLPAPGKAPFIGMDFFDEDDAEIFFGREELAERIARRVGEMRRTTGPRLLAIVGASGSGKSSLVRAGLVPLLKVQGECVALCTPGVHPQASLAGLDVNALWVIDQFEEVFTLCRSEEERSEFITTLLHQAEGVSGVVLVLRADFYAHCAPYPRLREAVDARQEDIGPMGTAELRRAIEEPVVQGGWNYEVGLVELAQRDVGAEPGGLPFLQHALLETWKHRRGRQLTLTGYAEAGGVHGAVALSAERVFQNLSPLEQAIARRIFLCLTELGEEAQDTRRRVAIEELTAKGPELTAEGMEPGEVETLLRKLAAERLVTLTCGAAEVAHEALIREWPALHEWLNQDRDGLRLHRHITEDCASWNRLGRVETELYRGAHLAQALAWAALPGNRASLNQSEYEFLDASRDRADRDAREEADHRQAGLDSLRPLAKVEGHSSRRLRWSARFLVGVLALGFVALAVWESRVAQQNAISAEETRIMADERASLAFARELAAQSSSKLESAPDLSILLALEAVRILRSQGLAIPSDVQQTVHDVANLSRLVWYKTTPGVPFMVQFFPDGSKITYSDFTARVLDANSGETIPFLEDRYPKGIARSAVSPNGAYFATAHDDNQIVIWDVVSAERLVTIQVTTGVGSGGAEFSPDGNFIVTSGEDFTARVWDLRPWQAAGSPAGARLSEPVRILGCAWPVALGISFSPNGRLVAATCQTDAHIRIWDIQTGALVQDIFNEGYMPFDSDFSPDGTRLATSSLGTITFIWDVQTGYELNRFINPNNDGGSGIEFSPDGAQLAITGMHTIVIDTQDGQPMFDFPARSSANFLAYSPDGRRLVTTHNGGNIQVWDTTLGGRGELGSVAGSPGVVFNHGSPDGRWIYETMPDGSLVLRSGTDLRVVSIQQLYPDKAFSGFFNRDSSRFISRIIPSAGIGEFTPDLAEVIVWDAETWQKLAGIPAEMNGPTAFNLNASGSLAAIGLGNNSVAVYEVSSGRELTRLPVDFRELSGIEFSLDGKYLAASEAVNGGGDGGRVAVWKSETGFTEISTPTILIANFGRATHMDFSPDGTRLAVCGANQNGEVWDLTSGELTLRLQGHTSNVNEIHYSQDGRYLVTASTDNSVRVWYASSGKQLLAYRQALPGGFGLALFSPDSQHVLAWGLNEIYFQFSFQDFEALLQIVSERVVRDWLPEECRAYLHSETCPGLP